jgi:hypothetical protein
VQRTRHEFLASAAFAEDQHRGVRRRDLLDHAADLEHRIVGGDEAFHRRGQLRLAQLAVLFFERVDVKGAPDQQPQHVGVDRLLVEIVRAE